MMLVFCGSRPSLRLHMAGVFRRAGNGILIVLRLDRLNGKTAETVESAIVGQKNIAA